MRGRWSFWRGGSTKRCLQPIYTLVSLHFSVWTESYLQAHGMPWPISTTRSRLVVSSLLMTMVTGWVAGPQSIGLGSFVVRLLCWHGTMLYTLRKSNSLSGARANIVHWPEKSLKTDAHPKRKRKTAEFVRLRRPQKMSEKKIKKCSRSSSFDANVAGVPVCLFSKLWRIRSEARLKALKKWHQAQR